MTDIIFLVLLFVHVGTVVLWMGAALLFVSVLSPSMAKLTGSARMEFMKVIGPAYEKYVIRNATIALVAGLILFVYITMVASSLAPSSSGMIWLVAGVLLALAAYIMGIVVIRGANHRILSLVSQPSQNPAGGPSNEVQMLQRRALISARLQALLLGLALLSMVIGANL